MISELITNLGIDKTLWVQFAAFIVLFLWMRFVFFAPFLKIIKEREAKTSGSKDVAEQLQSTAAQKEEEYALKLQEVKKAAHAEKEKILSTYRGQANTIIDTARKGAKEKIEVDRKQFTSEAAKSLSELQGQVTAMAGILFEKLTKEKVKL